MSFSRSNEVAKEKVIALSQVGMVSKHMSSAEFLQEWGAKSSGLSVTKRKVA